MDEGGDFGGVHLVVQRAGAGVVGEAGYAEGGLGAGEEDLEEGDVFFDQVRLTRRRGDEN